MKVLELVGVTKSFGDTTAVDGVSFEVEKGQAVSLLGPSGCGKTTTLRLIAGFETPDTGQVVLSGRDVAGKRPYERNVGLLFQDYALFPHMTVEQNVAYGIRNRGFARGEIPGRTAAMLSLVKLTGFEKRYPGQLSGGQQQRVALARALATEPEIMLLDEPLSALDAKLRQELRTELKEILTAVNATTVVVTHDQEEAMSLADDVIVMSHGQIAQRGTPTEIYSKPVDRFVAEFVGRSNWFSARLADDEDTAGLRRLAISESGGTTILVPANDIGNKKVFDVCVRPERIEVSVSPELNRTLPRDLNRIQGVVSDTVNLGSDILISVDLACGKRLLAIEKNRGQVVPTLKDPVTVSFAPLDCLVFPERDREPDTEEQNETKYETS